MNPINNISKETQKRMMDLVRQELLSERTSLMARIQAIEADLRLIDGSDGTMVANEPEPDYNFDRIGIMQGTTFREGIVNILVAKNKPLLSRYLWKLYNAVHDKDLDFGAFSSQLSPLSTDGRYVKKHEIPHNPIETRNYYGLSVWFINGRLKPDYLNKIKK